MGLFDSEYRTSVATVTSRVIAEKLTPHSVTTGTIAAVLNDGTISDYIMDQLVTHIGVKGDRMFDYAKKYHSYGVPSGKFVTPNDGQDIVAGLMGQLYGPNTTISYSKFGALNLLHFGWLKLQDTYGYSEVTNQLSVLSAQKKATVYLKDMVPVVFDAITAEWKNGSLAYWGTAPVDGQTPNRGQAVTYEMRPVWVPSNNRNDGSYETQEVAVGLPRAHTPLVVDPTRTADAIRVDYIWAGTTTVLVENVPITRKVVFEESLYIPVEYYPTSADYFQVKCYVGKVAHYFTYRLGQGTHLELDEIYTHAHDGLGTFYPATYFRLGHGNLVPGSTVYKESSSQLNQLGMDYDALYKAITANPGMGDVEQAMMIMAIPAKATHEIDIKYLFDFFDNAYYEVGGIAVEKTTRPIDTPISMVIHDKAFTNTLSFSGITKKSVVGSIGKVGTHTFVLDTYRYTTKAIGYTGSKDNIQYTYDVNHSVPIHRYRHQITPDLYSEIAVYGLSMAYYIRDGYSTVGTGSDDILLIPLDRKITEKYSLVDREILFTHSLQYVFCSYKRTEIAWYQQGWFGDLLMVIAIVVTVWEWGADNGALIAAVAAGTASAWALVMPIIMGLVINYAKIAIASLFIQAVGVENAFAIAMVAALAGSYQAIKAGSIKGAPYAMELLQTSVGITSAMGSVLQGKFAELQGEASAFDSYKEEKNKELETANKLLETDVAFSPFVIFGETPKEFFGRTVHAGNIGVAGIDAVSAFVDASLTLPKLSDSLGEYDYGLSV